MPKYKNETMSFSELSSMKTIPRYQRPLVWSKAQKAAFIDNISKGFPFGSLLLYKYGTDEKYSLIDGQQRFTTLEDYRKHPENYYPIEASDSEYVQELMKLIDASSQSEDAQAHIRSQLVATIKEMFRMHAAGENLDNDYLAQEVG